MFTPETKITEVKGIGPKKADAFKNINIETMEDVIFAYPREYEDRTNVKRIFELRDGETAMITAELIRLKKGRYVRGRKPTTTLLVGDGTGTMEVLFFNATWMEKNLRTGTEYRFFGKVTMRAGSGGVAGAPVMFHPQFSRVEDNGGDERILPVYPLVSGITQKERRRLAEAAVMTAGLYEDCFTDEFRQANGLCDLEYALRNIHFPQDERHMKVAKYRLIYEELLLFTLGLGYMKAGFSREKPGVVLSRERFEDELVLPFELTAGQAKALDEICRDMEGGGRMSRLVQGDVGSGKTAVAAKAIYKVLRNGCQAALMAPTEILAAQHLETFTALYEGTGIRIRLLTSSTPAAERKVILEELRSGETDVLIGTHALFSRDVEFMNLALVVTDEQHRFGVAQREALSLKGEAPHILVMTATPIPRTLALVLYADMDISIIHDKPAGRKEIITRATGEENRGKAYEFVKKQVKKGRQVYIVTALIETSDTLDVRSAEEVYEEAERFFRPYRTGFLHGRMKQDEKDRIMEDFKNGLIQVLVSTVVIEVGINVPNATVMIIENSERFGLAQMHQLRGRVGRGSDQSYCFLILGSDAEVAVERSRIMEETSDGFVIAEKDLVLRGTGEFFGSRQAGAPEMRIADIIKHTKILKAAAEEARRIIKKDPLLTEPENEVLKKRIEKLYGSTEYNG